MRDIDVRRTLREDLYQRYADDPDTVVVEELGILRGAARVDIAVVNGVLHGYEIKSEQDTLQRLRQQVELYCQVFDRLTLVVSERHLEQALDLIPEWCEVVVAAPGPKSQVALERFREGAENPGVDPRALVELLWRDEALILLAERGAEKGYLSKPRHLIWDRLCEVYSLDELREIVCRHLKHRTTLIQRSVVPAVPLLR